MSRSRLLYEFTVEAEPGLAPERLLLEAIATAEAAMETLSDGSLTWTVGESLAPEGRSGRRTHFFEVWGRRTARALLIDDMRRLDVDRIARTFDEGIAALRDEGPWDLLYLDYHLGEGDPQKNGHGIMCWIESHPDHRPKRIQLVTSDPDGRERMQVIVDRLYFNTSKDE